VAAFGASVAGLALVFSLGDGRFRRRIGAGIPAPAGAGGA
jgi:hypothetical protein